MNEQQIRSLIQQEIARSNSGGRFGFSNLPFHTHNGTDSPQVKGENITPSGSVTGGFVINEATEYTLNLNSSFTPQRIDVNGVLTGTSPATAETVRAQFVGTALLGPTFYLEDNEIGENTGVYRSVIDTQNIQFPLNQKPAQTSSFLWVDKSGTLNDARAGISRDHIISIFYGTSTSTADDVARVTVTKFSRSSITLDVPILVSGWTIFVTINIT